MSDKPANPSAFPLHLAVGPAGDLYDSSQADPGMSLRDYFAAQAIVGLCALITTLRDRETKEPLTPKDLPELAYSMADLMLKVRKS